MVTIKGADGPMSLKRRRLAFPDNPAFSQDTDSDGVPDEEDDFPDDQPATQSLAPEDFKAIGDRDWALIAKDPDVHVGEQIILYSSVWQFDAATGTDSFLAEAQATQAYEWFGFDGSDAFFFGTSELFADVVEDDLVKIWGTVGGSFSCDTQIGGNTTVPTVDVEFIEVYGSA
jgi:hypothetical protein